MRRNDMTQMCEAELKIMAAMEAVEKMVADVRLTDAVNLLVSAKDSVADFIEGVDQRRKVELYTL
jgi:hypothetical protein